MQETSLAILTEVHSRLSQLISEIISEKEICLIPKRLRLTNPYAVFLGPSSQEQQAIGRLYDKICTEHKDMHEDAGLPEGINPRVSFDHYSKHVAAPLLSELLIWSAHRDYPDVSETISIVAIQFDADWNMYAVKKNQY